MRKETIHCDVCKAEIKDDYIVAKQGNKPYGMDIHEVQGPLRLLCSHECARFEFDKWLHTPDSIVSFSKKSRNR